MNSRHLQFHSLCICSYFTVLCAWLVVNIKGRIVCLNYVSFLSVNVIQIVSVRVLPADQPSLLYCAGVLWGGTRCSAGVVRWSLGPRAAYWPYLPPACFDSFLQFLSFGFYSDSVSNWTLSTFSFSWSRLFSIFLSSVRVTFEKKITSYFK